MTTPEPADAPIVEDVADLTDADHDRAMQVCLDAFERLVASRDNIALGAYAEALVVASLPGARGTQNSWEYADVYWGPLSIQVKNSTGHAAGRDEDREPGRTSWSAPKASGVGPDSRWLADDRQLRHADLYLFVRHEGLDHRKGWSVRPVPTQWLDDELDDASYVSPGRLEEAGWAAVPFKDLPAWIGSRFGLRSDPLEARG